MTTTIIFTGSAGPGISYAAAATALQAAEAGRRALLIGLGSAAGLGALLEAELAGEPRTIVAGFDALVIDAPAELASAWERARAQMPGQLAQVAGDELPLAPGLELFFGLLRLGQLAPRYDLVVVEAGPHDTLLRALALPDGLRWGVRLLFGLDRGPGRSSASVSRAVAPTSFIPLDTLDRVQETRVAVERARDTLLTGGATARYVLRPDAAALAEARLAIPALQLHGLAVPALLAGPLLPEATLPRGAPLERQRALLVETAAVWPRHDLLRFELPQGSGLEGLREIGAQIGARTADTPAAPIAEQYAGEPAIALDLPGIPKGALRITLSGDELIVQVGPYRRHLLLPAALRGSSIKATREGERVIVRRR